MHSGSENGSAGASRHEDATGVDGDIARLIGERVADAIRRAFELELTPEETIIRPSQRPEADFQCNVAMSLGKRLGTPPRAAAQSMLDHLDLRDIADSVEIAGPGFLNIVLSRGWLEAHASSLLADPRLGARPAAKPRRMAIDYSSPNVAKEMHIGHLRSSIIGDALARMLRFAGHDVTAHNHIGDWGTPFGKLIEHLIDLGWAAGDGDGAGADGGTGTGTGTHSIHDLDGFYVAASHKFDEDDAFKRRSRERVVKLQAGDRETLELWQQLVDESARHFELVYDRLGILLTSGDVYGESFYNPWLGTVVDELEERGLTRISEGAVCTFPAGFTNRENEPLPLIVRKSDGGYGYAATDLATVRYWAGERAMDDLLYVVGTAQAQHFGMVFATSRDAGYLTPETRALHLGFGQILGDDGKKFSSRTGGAVKLIDVLDEAIASAGEVVAGRSQLSADEQASVARAVGVGAVKYQDLSGEREKDYRFSWERMLSTEGNTSVYLQYANARIHSILRRAAGEDAKPATSIEITAPAERTLVLAISGFAPALADAVAEFAPHKLCTYLFELATAFSGFYENCPIMASDVAPEVRASRLALATLTSRTLELGLGLLGIEAPERL